VQLAVVGQVEAMVIGGANAREPPTNAPGAFHWPGATGKRVPPVSDALKPTPLTEDSNPGIDVPSRQELAARGDAAE
jgi:hypothetical protein